jgi:hypothetical protein
MERRYLAFDTWPGCGVGCAAVLLAFVAAVVTRALAPDTSKWWLVVAALPPAAILTAVAFRVDRRGRRP